MERLAILQAQRSIQSPTILQPGHAAPGLGEFIYEVPGEAPPDIEAGVTAFASRIEAVGGLCLVRDKVLAVAGIINRVRPDEIRLCLQPVPRSHPQAGLQRVIGGACLRFLLVYIKEVGKRPRNSIALHKRARGCSQIECRNLRLAGLVNVAEPEQLGSSGSYV